MGILTFAINKEGVAMQVEARITTLETRLAETLGQLAAVQSAVMAVIGEPAPELRETLYEDLLELSLANWIANPSPEVQLEAARHGSDQVRDAMRHAFERRRVRPEFRNPPPRTR
jgi:uncharacterized coiled-coil protein SlyX